MIYLLSLSLHCGNYRRSAEKRTSWSRKGNRLNARRSDLGCLRKKGVPEEYFKIALDMYRSSKTQVVTQKGENE